MTFEEACRKYISLDPSVSVARLSAWEHGWNAALAEAEKRAEEHDKQVRLDMIAEAIEATSRVRANKKGE